MARLKLVIVVALGILTSIPGAVVIGAALALWRAKSRPPPTMVIRYVERAKLAPSAAPIAPDAERSER